MSAIIRGDGRHRLQPTSLHQTLYIQAPILETKDDPQILRNSGSLRGLKAVVVEAI
jgi:hypothetical protein